MRFVSLASLRPATDADQEFYATDEAYAEAHGGESSLALLAVSSEQRARIGRLRARANSPVIAVLEARSGYTYKWHAASAGMTYELLTGFLNEGPMTCGFPDPDDADFYYYMRGQMWRGNPDAYDDPDDFDLLLKAAVLEREQEHARKIARAHAVVSMSGATPAAVVRRETIPDDVKIFVWRRDQGRCVRCNTNAELEYDHVIPLSMGGSNTARNLQLLCGPCNRAKGGNLV